ncbi:hypothetical protein [uncultured Helicobacter sp.]|uniref:hypothetical protein n=1 Tax=uncultured Helicobacter sp. TaxID=175537 RepID=UPI00374E85DA
MSQKYLAKALGKDYQKEYYIWDCAAGTGNLIVDLNDKYKIYASTLDTSDVDIMLDLYGDRTLLKEHIFQFDFLNDEFFDKPCEKHGDKIDLRCKDCKESKLPKSLQAILQDPQKREKLIIYINPPYAEAASATTATQKAAAEGINKNKAKVATDSTIYLRYKDSMGKASNELFAQFFFRIYKEIPNCTLAAFSTLKYVNSSNFIKFRKVFKAKFLKGFIGPAYSFDNVKGSFPIGFLIWDLSKNDKPMQKSIKLDVYDDKNEYVEMKKISNYDNKKFINQWYAKFYDNTKEIGVMNTRGNDFQNQNYIRITSDNNHNHTNIITANNLVLTCIYLAVRHTIPATWLNDRDQFLYPNDTWKDDVEFQNDCLAFTLFHGQNRITAKEGVNHFIPFREDEINTRSRFESHFMRDFIDGKIQEDSSNATSKSRVSLFEEEIQSFIPTKPLVFSQEAQAVFEAGREIYKYYHQNFEKIPEIHSQHKNEFYKNYNPNVSLYDIKGYFQGFKENGQGKTKMNAKSIDSAYNALIAELRYALEKLAKRIEPKIYEYGFLLE